MYTFEGKHRRYYPDIFIPSENLIIEVKSLYTATQDVDRNNAKWEATKSAGYVFELLIL